MQLKRRADLIPQLVTTVQAYAAHERQLFEDIAEKRSRALAAGDNPAERGVAEADLARPVGRMMALAEGYPDLKASGNFLELQKELSDTEDKIEMARRFYNGAVRDLTYADMARGSARFANVLRTLGVAKGERVFALMGRGPEPSDPSAYDVYSVARQYQPSHCSRRSRGEHWVRRVYPALS